jgi:RNA polymerase sigma factor (sigma-70 family)
MDVTVKQNNDSELIGQYLRGDKKSLDILIEKYFRGIYSFLYSRVGNIADAEDLTQETFLKVWKNIKKFDRGKSFKPWVFQIAKNTSIDFFRKRKEIPFSRFEKEDGRNYFEDSLASIQPDLGRNIDNSKFLAVITGGISPEDKEILQLHKGESLTFKEVSVLLGKPINTIKSRYRRTIISIKKFFQS